MTQSLSKHYFWIMSAPSALIFSIHLSWLIIGQDCGGSEAYSGNTEHEAGMFVEWDDRPPYTHKL